MRAAPALPLVALLVALLAPSASAALLVDAPRTLDAPFAAGRPIAFEVPFRVDEEARVYAKLLPTPGNAVHDGERANGTLDPPTGWRVAFAFLNDAGARNDAGTRVDSTPTLALDAMPGESWRLEAIVHVPPDATPPADVHLALAASHPQAPGSGATLDASRAITLHLSSPPEAAIPANAGLLAILLAALLGRSRGRA